MWPARTSARIRTSAIALVASLVAPAALATPPQPPPRRLDEPGRSAMPARQADPRLAVAENGPVLVFSDDRDGELATRAASRNGGEWKSVPTPASSGARVAPDGDERAWMVWSAGGELRTRSTSGDGEWDEGPRTESGLREVAAVSGAGGLVAIALSRPQYVCIASASTAGHYPAPGVAVALLDARASSITEPEELLPRHLGAGITVAPDRTVWLAATDGDTVRVLRRDPRDGTWSDPEQIGFGARVDDVQVAALGTGEIVVAASGSSGVTARARSPITGAWSDGVALSPRSGYDLSLVTYRNGDALPLADERVAAAWTTGGRVRVAEYRPAPASLLPGEWTSATEIARSYDVALAARPGGLVLAYTSPNPGVVSSYRHLDVVIRQRDTDGTWSAPERAHDEEMRAADKQLLAVFETEAGFDAVWRDERDAADHDRVWLRASGIEGGAPRDIRIPNWPDAIGAPDGSIGFRWSDEDGYRIRVVTPEGEGSGFRLPDDTWPWLAASGPGEFLAAWSDEHRIRFRRYANGAWLPSVSTSAPDGRIRDIVGAGTGVGWIVWVDPAGNFASGDPASYRLRGTRVSADDVTTVTLANRRSPGWPDVSAAGDRRGGLAAAWIEPGADRSRVLFGAPGEEPTLVESTDALATVSVAATPQRDAVVAWRTWHDEAGTARRSAGGEFMKVDGLDPVPPRYDSDAIACGGVFAGGFSGAAPSGMAPPEASSPLPPPFPLIIAIPPPPGLSFDESRRAHAMGHDGPHIRVWSLSPEADEWERGLALGPLSARVAASTSGRVGSAWVEGAPAERRVMGMVARV